ncbi:MAG: hypothetical protein K1060chlam1_01065 [Candidatus Anoxychlamydiales bacterium]|nr:hypothetical protein [Candidatus Anoxychlamydiales bacterium]
MKLIYMFFKNFKNIFLICFFFTSCTYRNSSQMEGIEDFVLASNRINDGKVEILKMQGKKVEKLDDRLLIEKKEKIKEDDILNIEIYHPKRDDLINLVKTISSQNGFLVREKKIFLPKLGYLKVENLSIKEAKEKIQKRYLDEIEDIEVFVSFKEKKANKVEVAGLVNALVPIDAKMRLFDVLIKASLPASANLFKSYVLRDNSFLPVDLYKLMKEGDMSQNIYMENNDKIYIAEGTSSKIYVLGEVHKQGAVNILDGKISLKDAIAEAGGVSLTADKSFIQIFRANVQDPKIYLLNFKHIIELPSASLNLIEGDIVLVGSTIISDWNKFVNQILPSISIFDSAYRGFKNMGIIINGP